MANDNMTDNAWDVLINAIREGSCTPFLGAGINSGVLPTGGQIAKELSDEYQYPLDSCHDLDRVAQFISISYSQEFVKSKVVKRLRRDSRPDITGDDPRLACLKTLAELPLPLFITTNYDDLMYQALRHTRQKKTPRMAQCVWDLRHGVKAKDIPKPDISNPLVYHLHGVEADSESIVLTEDDYMDFLVRVSADMGKPMSKFVPGLLPSTIREAFKRNLLFIGYSMRDVNFRVLHRGLAHGMFENKKAGSVAVQMSPPDGHVRGAEAAAQKYLKDYFRDRHINVYWGTAAEFAEELKRRLGDAR